MLREFIAYNLKEPVTQWNSKRNLFLGAREQFVCAIEHILGPRECFISARALFLVAMKRFLLGSLECFLASRKVFQGAYPLLNKINQYQGIKYAWRKQIPVCTFYTVQAFTLSQLQELRCLQ